MKNSTWKWLQNNFKSYNLVLAGIAVVSSVLAFLAMFSALITKNIIDTLVGDNASRVWIPLLIGVGIIVLIMSFRQLQGYLVSKNYGKMKKMLTLNFSKNIFCKDYFTICQMHSGELLNLSVNDIDNIVGSYIELFPLICSIVVKFTLGVTFIAIIDWRLLVLCIVVAVASGLIAFLLRHKIKHLSKKLQESYGKVYSSLQDCYQNIEMIKTYQIADFATQNIESNLNKYNKQLLKINNTIVAINSVIFGIYNVGFYVIIVASIALLGANDNLILGIGSLTAMLQIVQLLKEPMLQLTGIVGSVTSMVASVERLGDIEKLVNDNAQTRQKIDFDYININNLTFAYADNNIIENLSYTIKKGEIVGIAGESGAGKSTLLKIILGLLKAKKGDISVVKGDDIIPIDKVALAYVPQQNYVFSGTIRDNLTLGRNFDENRLIDVCKKAQIYDDIVGQPHSFDTYLGENGVGFSVGQNQRLAIARALLFDYDILVFDEATSALDEQTANKIMSNIKIMNKTIFFVTHNEGNFAYCDKIVNIK